MRKLFLPAAVAVLALAVAATALAASKQSGTLKLTAKQELAATGLVFDVKTSNGDDGKPEAIKQFVVTLPKGAKFDGRGAPRCDLTDAEFMESVRKNCPANTKVGQGTVTATSNGTDSLTVKLLFFNLKPKSGPASKADLAVAFELGGNQVTVLEAVGRANKLTSAKLTGELPGGFRVKRLKGSIAKRTKGQRNLISNPLKCPKSGKWTISITDTFPSGKNTLTKKTPCNRSAVR